MKLFSTIGLNLQVENSQSLSTWMVLNVPRFSPRPPCTNGVIEKSIKIARCIGEARFGGGESTREWLQHFANFLLMYCTTLHNVTRVQPAQLFLKCKLPPRFSQLKPDMPNTMAHQQELGFDSLVKSESRDRYLLVCRDRPGEGSL